MKFIYCAFGLPHLLNHTVSATVYHSPAERFTTPDQQEYVSSSSIHALGIIKSEMVIVFGAGSRDLAARAALERLGSVEQCVVLTEPTSIGRQLLALPGDVVMYGDSIG